MSSWAFFWKMVFCVSVGLFFAVAAVVAVRGFLDLIQMFSRLKDMNRDHDK
jgi:hypothetical protein